MERMCCAILRLRAPRYGMDTLAGFWRETFHFKSTAKLVNSYPLVVGVDKNAAAKRSIKIEASSKGSGLGKAQCCDIQKWICEKKLIDLISIIGLDIETTGLRRRDDRIVEVGFHDINGGENSVFHTLVNPGRVVLNSNLHGITNKMVNRPGVPRMEELIPIILTYIKSRQKPGGLVLLFAHNGKSFDVPFLQHEFARHSYEIPGDWRFLDTLSLARELIKSRGVEFSGGVSLKALREHYGIRDDGMKPHRAISDVLALSRVLQRLTFDLEVTKVGLLERSFVPSRLVSIEKI